MSDLERTGIGSWPEDPVPIRFVQAVARFLAALFEIGGIAYTAWAWSTWNADTWIDIMVLFPAFFPVSYHEDGLCDWFRLRY
jgi:hypothetical protein